MPATIIRFLNIILVALLAGCSFGIWIGFNPAQYGAPTYIEQQQHLVRSLNTLMVTFVLIAAIVTTISAFLQKQNKQAFFSLLLAAFFLVLCMVISRFGNLPVQTEMLTWNPEAAPGNWMAMRDKWWSFHVMRTIAEWVALVLVAWNAASQKNTH